MRKRDYAQEIDRGIPVTPRNFKLAIQQTLDDIVAENPVREPGERKTVTHKRRALAFALVLIVLIATVAVAATQWHIFDTLSFLTGVSPQNADQVMQGNLAKTTVNGVEITIQEAGYDGKTLFIQYTYRIKDVDRTLGEASGDGVYMEDLQLLADYNVGWWIDHLWIDGKCVDMPNNSGSVTIGSEVSGEIVQAEYWRLDNEGISLSGKVEIALPIGERQPLENYQLQKHPEMYGEDGNLLLPEKGMVSFTLDTTSSLSGVRTEHPNVPVKGDNVIAQCSEVYYSPLMTYITLQLEGDQDAVAAYKAENGEGFYGSDGSLLWEYGGMEVFDVWISSLALVDGAGTVLFPDQSAMNGYGNEWAEFVYPHIETVPEELYMAPVYNGAADLTQAIKIK